MVNNSINNNKANNHLSHQIIDLKKDSKYLIGNWGPGMG